MTGYLHALVEDAAREAGCSVTDLLSRTMPRRLAGPRWKAMMAAAEAGYSREQIARVINRDKRTVVRALSKVRQPKANDEWPAVLQALPARLHRGDNWNALRIEGGV